jgi:uncharacterized protein
MKAPFAQRDAFLAREPYRLLPFRFERLDERRYVATNDVGEHLVLSRGELVGLVHHTLPVASRAYEELKARHFLMDEGSAALDLLALKHRTKREQSAAFTGLHIFVVTLRCDHSCHYCQVSRQTEDKVAYDLSDEAADRAVDLVFRSPSRQIKIEFQGGEPLLAFATIRRVVERAEQLNRVEQRDLAFVITSNLSRLDDEILAFCLAHDIHLSTSLDGPQPLHDAQRPLRGGSSYEAAVRGIRRARARLGHDRVSALMTTTRASLEQPEAIVDEYADQGFPGIFLRSISPFGFAVRQSLLRRYETQAWLAFYKRGLARVLTHNQGGRPMREEWTAILLQKLLSPTDPAYVDLQSPAGLAIGAIVYNYDGAVFASDEGRMLAEMGDTTFRLGHLLEDSYEAMLGSDRLLDLLDQTLLESAPQCSECAFLPHCGADPVFHQATQGDALGHKAFSAFCEKQMGVMRHLITLLEDNPAAARILRSWVA